MATLLEDIQEAQGYTQLFLDELSSDEESKIEQPADMFKFILTTLEECRTLLSDG